MRSVPSEKINRQKNICIKNDTGIKTHLQHLYKIKKFINSLSSRRNAAFFILKENCEVEGSPEADHHCHLFQKNDGVPEAYPE